MKKGIWNAYKSYVKCKNVLASCRTLEQITVAHNMIFFFGKRYNFNWMWEILDTICCERFDEIVDEINYERRKKHRT